MDWSELVHEYDLDAKRLLPFDALKAPFEGAWCVVRPRTVSLWHEHHERELFIGISGTAEVKMDEKIYPISKGDIIAIPPYTHHCIINNGTNDFHMYSIWWDRALALNYIEAAGEKS
jgi:mannose-6-phosphate isomerase-like protein (cupin superfamily)